MIDLHCCYFVAWPCWPARQRSPSHCPPASHESNDPAPATDGSDGGQPSCGPSRRRKLAVFWNKKRPNSDQNAWQKNLDLCVCVCVCESNSGFFSTSASWPEPQPGVFLNSHVFRKRRKGSRFRLPSWCSWTRSALRGMQRIGDLAGALYWLEGAADLYLHQWSSVFWWVNSDENTLR